MGVDAMFLAAHMQHLQLAIRKLIGLKDDALKPHLCVFALETLALESGHDLFCSVGRIEP